MRTGPERIGDKCGYISVMAFNSIRIMKVHEGKQQERRNRKETRERGREREGERERKREK